MKKNLIYSILATLIFSGCGDEASTDLQDSLVGNTVEDKIAGYVVFNPDEGKLPYPNNILLAPNSSTTDDYDFGQTLNIPYEPEDADANIKRQLNTLTGFSTTSPITCPISTTLDTATIPAGVQLYKVDINATGHVVSINSTLTFGVDYFATQSGDNLVILPLKPLDSLATYMPVLTNALKDTQDRSLAPDYATALTLSPNPVEESSSIDASTAASLEAIRQANQAMFAALVADGKDPSNTVAIWNFRTQNIGSVQASIAATSPQANLALGFAGATSKDILAASGVDVSSMYGIADVYVGTLSNLPQFMPQANFANPSNVFTGEFSYSSAFVPTINTDINVSVITTVPNATSGCTEPGAGWPVVIYQHGITRSRTDLLAFAETFASQCFAAIAIDLPLHGVTESNTSLNPFYTSHERTFDVDVVTEVDGNIVAAVPDGIIDSSGAHYINLANITTTRDNLHQTTSDLLQLQSALTGGGIGVKFNTGKIHFLAHSLGTIASTGFINHSNTLNSITLAMPGQGLAELLNNSADYGPVIEAGLAAQGIFKGTSEYASFMLATQTIVDDADPANYAASIGTLQANKILAFEIIGDGVDSGTSDQVIPNNVVTAPLSGTDPFLALIGAEDINASTTGAVTPTSNTVTRLLVGGHSSPLDPTASPAATTEIHTQLISYISSDTAAIIITDNTIIKQ